MSSFSESASSLTTLEAGRTALQAGQIDIAIAQFTDFLSTQADHSDAPKAKMGLVQAYVKGGKSEAAIALCQELQQSQHEKVRSWATQMMAKLSPVDPGFVLIDPGTQPIRPKPSPQPLAPKPSESVQSESPHVWKNTGRAQRWNPLPRLNPTRLQWAMVGSTIALLFTLSALWGMKSSIAWAQFSIMTRLLRWSAAPPDQSIPILEFSLGLLILFCAAPWILDAVLKGLYGLKPLSTAAIARHSPETHRLIQRFAQQQKIPIPKLGVLPTAAPISFTYGNLPKFARIVVSQGLLDSLNEEEIAAIYAGECGHILHWDFAAMSLVTVVLQIPYSVYKVCAIVSDRLRKIKLNQTIFTKIIQTIADGFLVISAIAYGFFRVFRWSGFWLAQQRTEYSDRTACNLTGNPNGLARALIKTTIATAQTIKHERETQNLLEGFELLNPVSYRSAILFENLFDRVSLSTLFQSNLIHLGTRLEKLMIYCQQWHLELELEIAIPTRTKAKSLIQFAPIVGSAIGIAIALILWLIAQALFAIGNFRLNWLASDYSLFPSFALIGFGIGSIVRFNHLFPESRNPKTDLILTHDPKDSPVVRLEGTLIGRSGAANQLAQDLFLQTETGLIKLNYCSQFGAIGNLLRPLPIGQTAIVTGWLRRSETPWIDVDTIRSRLLIRAGQPIWSFTVAIAAILLGIAQIL
ncbi:M48 family metalloprotease [Leptolyngbya sp. NIES-2104]|uniref:M48 family metalloprotease n=1 Tax=Leptolyngbya sp. NIES-2104 TaxID=1552121 RepID=UPI0006ECBB72|nr:zinc metalloprotease HtpX [Leptolyngbya sp. NIES-2104]GAP98270.1 protease HtpX-like protein [Leptolyngbya sp. NIES-2104]